MTKGNVFCTHLFDPTSSNRHYRYHGGWNLQALIAYCIGIALPFPGFAASLGASGVNVAGQRLFSLGWLLSFFTSLVAYPLICAVWPTKNQKMIRESGMAWEQAGNEFLTAEQAGTGVGMGEGVGVGVGIGVDAGFDSGSNDERTKSR